MNIRMTIDLFVAIGDVTVVTVVTVVVLFRKFRGWAARGKIGKNREELRLEYQSRFDLI